MRNSTKFVLVFLILVYTEIGLCQKWERCSNGIESYSVLSLAENKTTGTMFAGLYAYGIYRSTDKGLTWIATSVSSETVYSLAATESSNYIFCGLFMHGVIRSSNDGVTWVGSYNPQMKSSNSVFTYGDTVLCGIGTLLGRSTNNGNSWNGMINYYVLATDFAVRNNYIYFSSNLSTSKGIYRTSNYGTNWILDTAGLSNLTCPYFARIDSNLFIGTNNGVYLSVGEGEVWAPVGLQGNQIYDIEAKGNKVFAAAHGKGVFKTGDNGLTWTDINKEFDTTYANNVTCLSATSYYLYAGTTAGVWRYNLQKPLSPTLISPVNNSVSISLTPNLTWSGDTIARDYHLQISTDSVFASTALDSNGIFGLQFSVPEGKLVNNTPYYWRVSAVNDNGESMWSAVYKFTTIINIPNVPALLSPINGAMNQTQTPTMKWNIAARATSYRLQISADSTFASTTMDSAGITRDSVKVPSGKLSDGVKYYWRVNATNSAGTSGWSAKFNFTVSATGTGSIVSELPKEYKLYDNYPNPFNPTTKIKFDIPKNGLIKIAIYDMLGREVKMLMNENMTAGSYEVEWNATIYASGVYFYKMTAGSFSSVKKMFLIK